MKVDVVVQIGAGLALMIFGILVIAVANNAWLWGAGCISLGIAILTASFFAILAKIAAIACPCFFVLGLIFQRGWLS